MTRTRRLTTPVLDNAIGICRALGLEPSDVGELVLTPTTVEVKVFRHGDDGRKYIDPGTDAPAVELRVFEMSGRLIRITEAAPPMRDAQQQFAGLLALAAEGLEVSLSFQPHRLWPHEAEETPVERRWVAWATTVPGTDMCQYRASGASPAEALLGLHDELGLSRASEGCAPESLTS